MADNNFDPFGGDDPFGGQQSVTPGFNTFKTVGTNKLLIVLFLVDCSRSMDGERISAVNAALREVKSTLQEIKSNNNLELKIAIMSFTSSAKWELQLTNIDEVSLVNIKTRAGLTEYGNAFHELNKVLRKDQFMKHTGKIAPPAIMFLTDGGPTDDYELYLEELLKNGWFANASRSAILLGDAINDDKARDAVSKFVNDPVGDITDADNSTTIIQKINLATMHTVAGDPMKSDTQPAGNGTDKPSEGDNPVEPGKSGGDSNPFGDADPFKSGADDSFGGSDTAIGSDPFGGDAGNSDLFGGSAGGSDPFGGGAGGSDPFGGSTGGSDPFGGSAGGSDPFDGSAGGSGFDSFSGGGHLQGNAADDSFGEDAVFGGTYDAWDVWEDHGVTDVLYCRNCNSSIAPGTRFCPYCGYPVGIEQPDINMQNVEFSAIAPKAIMKGDSSIISILMYEENSRFIVDELIRTSDEPAQDIRSGVYKVGEGSEVKIILSSRDVTIENNTMTGIWQGRHLSFYFMIYLPNDYKKRDVLCSASVYINNVIASNLIFKVKCLSIPQKKIEITRKDVLSAFISYASQDRRRVALIIQGMKKIRPELDVFFDVSSLRSGDNWERVLPKEIEKRDVLYLFWSHFAKESEWVEKEWRYALKMKGDRYIEPFPLELPENCPPPEELKHKSFNDILLYVIYAQAEKERN